MSDHSYDCTEEEAALPPGEWVQLKGVRHYVVTFARKFAATPIVREKATDMTSLDTRHLTEICLECGCLNYPDESCIGCQAWAERVVVSASWRMVEVPYTKPLEVAS